MCSGVDNAVRRIEIGGLEEQAAECRREEQDDREQHQERAHAEDVLDGVVRVKRNTIERLALGIHVSLISMPSGLFEPTWWRATMCSVTRSSKPSGTATTCKEKKRFSVASEIP